MTSKLTIEQAKHLRNDFECWQQDYDPKDDKEQYDMFGRGMAAMDMLIAGMYQEPVAYWRKAFSADGFCYADGINSKRYHDENPPLPLRDGDYWEVIPLYPHAQLAPELTATVERLNASGYEYEGEEVTPQNVAAVVDILLQQLDDAVQGRDTQPAPVVPEIDRKAIADKVYGKCCRIPGATFYNAAEFAIDEVEACRTAMLQAGNSPVIPDGYVMVPMRLTAENGAKGVLSGEFSETKFVNCPECFGDDECETCDGSGRIEIKVPVSWTTIKDIWIKGVEHFAAAPQENI